MSIPRSSFALGLFLVFGILNAQPDTLSYYVVLKNDSGFACQIPYQIPQKMIRVRKADNTEEIILWKDISSISVMDSGKRIDVNTLSKKDLNEMRERARLNSEHKRWASCFLVLHKGDTLY